MKRRDAILVWSLTTAAFLAVWLLTASATALLGCLFLLVLLPVGLCLNLLARQRLRVALRTPASAEKNEEKQIDVRLCCGFWRPAGAVEALLSLENRLTGITQTQRVILTVQNKEYVGSCSLTSPTCGSVRVRVQRLRLFDWSGLLAIGVNVTDKAYCTILPQVYAVRLPAFSTASQTQEVESYRENTRGSDRSETVWLRDYVAGDAIGGIHWKLSSKLDRLIYREPGAPEDRTLLLFWDRRAGSPQALDAMGDGVFSICQALRDAGVPFTLGFVQDGEIVLQRIADADTLYRTLPLLLRRDRDADTSVPDFSGFGVVLYVTAGDAPEENENIHVLRCADDAPQRLRVRLQETDGLYDET